MKHDIKISSQEWLREQFGLTKSIAKASPHPPMAVRYDEIERARKVRSRRKLDKKFLYKKKPKNDEDDVFYPIGISLNKKVNVALAKLGLASE